MGASEATLKAGELAGFVVAAESHGTHTCANAKASFCVAVLQ